MTYEARSGSNLLENISNHSEGANTGLDVVYSCIEDDWTLCSSDKNAFYKSDYV
jgi:hypothetical protein